MRVQRILIDNHLFGVVTKAAHFLKQMIIVCKMRSCAFVTIITFIVSSGMCAAMQSIYLKENYETPSEALQLRHKTYATELH